MSYTKRQIVLRALSEIGISQYDSTISPEDLRDTLWRLDSLIAEWNERGIVLGYPLYTSPEDSSLDEDSALPDWSIDAVASNLSVRIAPMFGKVALPDTKMNAQNSYKIILRRFAKPPKMQFPNTLPVGAGNKARLRGTSEYFVETEPLEANGDTLDV